jgi:hypothetical protein
MGATPGTDPSESVDPRPARSVRSREVVNLPAPWRRSLVESGMRRQTTLLDRVVVAGFVVASAVLAAWFVLGADSAAAQARTHSFEGSCSIVGVAEVVRPVTVVPSANYVVFRGHGLCSGTLDGERLPGGGAPVALTSYGDKLTGCTTTVVPRLTVEIWFAHGKTIRGTAQVTFQGPSMSVVMRGDRSGVATATGTIQGGSELLEDCVAGRLTRVGIAMDMVTISQLVSDASASSGGGSGHAGAAGAASHPRGKSKPRRVSRRSCRSARRGRSNSKPKRCPRRAPSKAKR